jgi:hypothetical protein
MRILSLLTALLLCAGALAAQERISRGDRAKMRETRETMKQLQLDLATLNQMRGTYPENLKALVDDKLREALPKDAWGREFAYQLSTEQGYRLTSWGADGKAGGEGGSRDIVWTAQGELRELSTDEKAAQLAKLEELRFQASRLIARKRMVQVGAELVNHRRDKDAWPKSLDDCKRTGNVGEDAAVNRCFTDPWDKPFALKLLPNDNFAVVCWGLDGKEGGLGRDADFVITERDVRAEHYRARDDYWGWRGGYSGGDWRVQNLAEDVQRYKEKNGKLPEELADLTRGGQAKDGGVAPPIRNALPRDSWGNDYVYVKLSEEEFYIVGLGKDGIEGGIKDNADVIYPKPGTEMGAIADYEDWEGEVIVEEAEEEPADENDALAVVAREYMLDIIDKLNAHKAEKGALPESLDEIKDAFVGKVVPADPWENAFSYTLIKDAEGNVTGFTLTCLGSDGAQGGEGNAADIILNQDGEPLPAPEKAEEAEGAEGEEKPKPVRKFR